MAARGSSGVVAGVHGPGLAGVHIGKHIKALFGWAWLLSILMLVVAIAIGQIPPWAS